MASDNLNEIGKYIQKTRKDTDFALARYHATIPKVERTRDVFDSEIPFQMVFETENNQDTVTLDLIFNLPPPLGDCNTDCLQATCQTFDVGPGDHLVTVDNPYNAGSVTAFVDYVQSLPSGYEEVSPGAGTVFVQGSETTSKITICYTYGDCNDFDDSPCPPLDPTKSAFIGLTPIFTDVFSRTGSAYEPSNHCGYWADSSNGNIFIGNGEGSISGSGGIDITFENAKVSSANVEAVFKLDESFTTIINASFSYGPYLFPGLDGTKQEYDSFVGTVRGSSVRIVRGVGNNIAITTSMDVTYLNSTNLNFIDQAFDTFSKVYDTTLTDASAPVFVRIAQIESIGIWVRIWNQDEVEPSFWTVVTGIADYDAAVELAGITYSNLELALPIVSNIHLGTGASIQAVTVWGEPGSGFYSAGGIIQESWNLDTCLTNPDGLTRFGYCSSVTSTLLPTTVDSLEEDGPSYSVGMSWPHFVANTSGLGLLQDMHQKIRTFEAQGHPLYVRISGLLRSDNIFNVPFTALFYAYDLSGAPPTVGGYEMIGTPVGSALSPGDGSYGTFSIVVPTYNGRVTWGVGFAGGPSAVEGALGGFDYHASFLSVNNTGAGVAVRALKIEAVGSIDCSTNPFCPDSVDAYNARCGDVANIFDGPSYPKFCTDGTVGESPFAHHNDSWTSAGGTYTTWRRQQGVALDITGDQDIARLSWTAFGVSTTGVDGRCPPQFSATKTTDLTRTSSDADGLFQVTSPYDCTAIGAETTFEFKIPRLIPAAIWNVSGGGTRTPEFDLTFSDNNFAFLEFEFGDFATELFLDVGELGNQHLVNPINEAGVWWTIKILTDETTFKLKVWKSSDAEPSTWYFQDTLIEPLSNIEIGGDYANYSDDDFFVEFRNINVTGHIF